MIDHLFWQVYVSDIPVVIVTMFILLITWSVIGVLLYKRMRIIGAIIAVISVAAIIYTTVIARGESNTGLELVPFSSFTRAIEQPEMYRSMLMNVFLFMPLGMSLPFVFGGKTWKRILLTILIGLLLSAAIETIQLICSSGLVEIDDVICNTFGAAIGSCAYLLSLLWIMIAQMIKKGKKPDE